MVRKTLIFLGIFIGISITPVLVVTILWLVTFFGFSITNVLHNPVMMGVNIIFILCAIEQAVENNYCNGGCNYSSDTGYIGGGRSSSSSSSSSRSLDNWSGDSHHEA